MKITYWKIISFIISLLFHIFVYYFDLLSSFTDDDIHDLMSDLFTSSITLIGFIFAVIAILVTITEHSLIKTMRENGMYRQILVHLKYLLQGFSVTSILSYTSSMINGEYLIYLLLCTSVIFMYSLLMLVTDMFIRLTLTFINMNN